MPQHVNFIAERLETWRRACWWRAWGPRWAGLLAILTVALLWGAAAYNGSRAARLAADRAELDGLRAAAAQAASLEAELARLDGPRRLARGVHANNAQWLALCREIRDRLPAEAWLTTVEVAPASPGVPAGAVRIEGQATGHAAIGAYLTALCGSPWLHSVRLVGSERDETADQAPTRFAFEARLRQPIALLGEAGG